MKQKIKQLVLGSVAHSSLGRRWGRRLGSGKLGILMYHGLIDRPLPVDDWCFLDVGRFREQLLFLKDHFQVLPLSVAAARLKAGQINEPAACITFDDGFQSNYKLAYPVLQELGIPATIFVSTRFVDSDDTVWFCRVYQAVVEYADSFVQWQGTRYPLGTPAEKAQAIFAITESLKSLPGPILEKQMAELVGRLGGDPARPVSPDSPFRMLSSQAIAEMAASGLVEFGGHTHSHYILSRLSSEEVKQEVHNSTDYLKQWIGQPPQLFSYPNGSAQDYNQDAVAAARSAGIKAAVSTVEGPNGPDAPVLELRRYGIGSDLSPELFQMMVLHIVDALKTTRARLPF